MKLTLTVAVAALLAGSPAWAAIIGTYADRDDFLAAAPGGSMASLALPGAPPVIVAELVTGGARLTARDGALAGDGGDLISTELDRDRILIRFAQPVFAFGLLGGVVDEPFDYIDGSLLVRLGGSGSATLDGVAGAPVFLGLISDTAFKRVVLSVGSFDRDASSVAFVGIEGALDIGSPAPPLPAAPMLALFGLACGGLLTSRRRVRCG